MEMKTAFSKLLAFFAIYFLSLTVFAQTNGAKEGFWGDMLKETSEIKTTSSGTALFSGTEVKTETITPPKESKTGRTSNPKVAKASGRIATGLCYWIEVMKSDSKIDRCTAETRVFKSGERIRFAFKTNKEGYIYLLLIGSSGRGRSLFPDPRINEGNNFITNNKDYRIPFGDKTFVMDGTPGEERILVFFSESEIVGINNYFLPNRQIEPNATRQLHAFGENNGSKDILFEEDVAGVGMKPASYFVTTSTNPKTILFREIKMRHR